MKFYLSTAIPDLEQALSVKVNNVQVKKRKLNPDPSLIKSLNEKLIEDLNELAAKPPFCQTHKAKKHDPL